MADFFSTKDSKLVLPTEYAQTVFAKARETSVVGRLATASPLTLGGTTLPIYNGEVNMGVVAEGARKPVEKPEAALKTITPMKMASIVVVSDEMVRADPGQMFEAIQADMSDAVGRALDALVLYGADARTGNKIPGQTAVLDSTKAVELAKGDYKTAVLAGFDLVGENYDVNGIAADSRTKGRLLATVNEVQFGLPNLAAQDFTVAGVPAAFGRSVGRVGKADKDTRLVIGDWSKIRYGFATGVEISRSNEATIVDESGEVVSLFQNNLLALRIETFIGATVLNSDAFAVVKDAVAG